MCRHLAYVGEPIALSHLLFDPLHSLEHQSYAARELLEGHVAADGFGVSWYPGPGSDVVPAHGAPLLYRSERPIWADPVWRALAARLTGRTVLANVRNATDPTTLGLVNVHPFTSGRWAFTHNGFLAGFRTNFLRSMRASLSDARNAMVSGSTDTETLFFLLLDRLDEEPDPAVALASLVRAALERAEEAGVAALLNLILTDGDRVWATRAGTTGRSNSLYVAHGHAVFRGDLIASEPLDADPCWSAVPHGSLVTLEPGGPPRVSRV